MKVLLIKNLDDNEFRRLLRIHKDIIFFTTTKYIGYLENINGPRKIQVRKYKNKRSIEIMFIEFKLPEEAKRKLTINTNKIVDDFGDYIDDPNYLGYIGEMDASITPTFSYRKLAEPLISRISNLIYDNNLSI
jgi:hypothetical protein